MPICQGEQTHTWTATRPTTFYSGAVQRNVQGLELSGSTLNGPVYKESPWAVSDIVKPAIMTVLQDPEEEVGPQPAARPQVSAALLINPSIRVYVPRLLERPWQGPA